MLKYLLIIGMTMLFYRAEAAHLVGGDLSFQCTGSNTYSFQLSIYREANATAQHDPIASLFIYNLDNGQLFDTRGTNGSNPVIVANNDLGPCLQNPSPPRYDFAIYNYNGVVLPPNTNGYRVIYQRCCRSANTINIPLNFDGFSQGSTYEVIISPKVMSECNGTTTSIPSMEFDEFPPTQLCVDQEVTVDQSVVGSVLGFLDSVSYSICAPYEGGSGTNCITPTPGDPGNCFTPDGACSEPCNYSTIDYSPGYTAQTPMGPLSTVTINSNGTLVVNPDATGVYVVGICATGYKDGQIWSAVRRDFQFKVFDCIADGATPPIAQNGDEIDLSQFTSIDSVELESAYIICNELEVEFDQNSTQAISHFWDFGVQGIDSDTSNDPVPTFMYPDTGVYVVTYIVNKGQVCVDTAYGVVKIFPNFFADFTFDAGCFSLPVQFMDSTTSTLLNNPPITWDWNFGVNILSTSTDPNPSFTYPSAGNWDVVLIVESVVGCIDTIQKTVVTDPAPTADFDNLLTCTGSNHIFDNLSSLNGTNLLNYSWDFGDGNGFNLVTTDLVPPPQVYNTAGTYTIQLIINSTSGCSDTISKTLTVIESVVADFDYNPTMICPGQEIQFNNTTAQAFDSVIWYIEGNNFDINNPIYDYSTPGTKPVSLVVFSSGICIDSIGQNIIIEDGPFADFNGDSTCTGADYVFDNLSMDNGFAIDQYLWTFGDGTSDNGFEPTHAYMTAGNYPVTLIVNSSLVACSDTTTDTMYVKAGIVSDFSFAPDTICEDRTTVNFTNLTTGGTWDSLLWDFGDNSSSIDNDPSHVYTDGGVFDANLSIYDDICGVFNTTKIVEVFDVPDVNLPDSLNVCDGQNKTLTVTGNVNYDILWSTGETSESIVINNTFDTLIVVINNQGCVESDTTFITRDCPAYIPNTFTPNGDGVNDFFGPLDLNITSFTLRIYNRWGEQIFETSSFDNGWDGNYTNGKSAPLDTYTYILDGIGLDNKTLFETGAITLIR